MATVTTSFTYSYEDAVDLTDAFCDAYNGQYQQYLAAARAASPPPPDDPTAEAMFVGGVRQKFAEQCVINYNVEILSNYRAKKIKQSQAIEDAAQAEVERTKAATVATEMTYEA